MKTYLYDTAPIFALLYAFAPYLFLPLLILLPMTLILKDKHALIGLAVVVLLFITQYGLLFFPQFSQPSTNAGQQLDVLTYNLGPGRARPKEVFDALVKQDADIVAVQEVSPSVVDVFSRGLNDTYPYMILDPPYSTGLLSRYPILSSKRLASQSMDRTYLHVTIDWQQPLHVLVVHPQIPDITWSSGRPLHIGLRDQRQREGIKHVAEYAEILPMPVIIMGDFNMTPQSDAYTRITTTFVDTHTAAGFGFGFSFPNDTWVAGYELPWPLCR
ncbi:MAG: endonuclease/exonuclease/phosphatase family protein [Chloroflexota bacterium]